MMIMLTYYKQAELPSATVVTKNINKNINKNNANVAKSNQ